MKTIFKYKLEAVDTQTLELPSHYDMLSVESQKDDIVLYCLVDTDIASKSQIKVKVRGTGHNCNDINNSDIFIGTIKMYNDRLVFHVFYAIE